MAATPEHPQPQPLALLLLRASRWFDAELLDRLEVAGWPRLTSAQSLVFPHLSPEGISPTALARALGVARQSGHELAQGLVALGLLESRPDPASRRSRLLVLTDRGRALAADARRILAELEQELAAGVEGADPVDTAVLRGCLGGRTPWSVRG